ncbi:sigma-E processing peptidase SpoIIGA [Cytobacillus depressus]|uniref:Sigma-E processing peptidase SpoIIGA n=1 Tax=Cytobacillus depressus TaxID=1602942 RepID=A0A6L3V7L2_9BACI|nr:sigma-E processing peptidase SpoIIGA [Cytobacillus depressus]KAB2337427.1 sigma-E processing peptidase SpoIIGA [Cytobacillus depressus]
MEVYVDIIWILNFLFDSLLLYLTAIILKRDIRLWRIICGGLIGSVIILLSLTPLNTYSAHPLTKLLFSIFMVLMVFGYKRLRYFISGLLTFYCTTFLIGGMLIGAHYFVKFDLQISSSLMLASVKGFGDPISWLFVLLGFPIAWHFSKRHMEEIEMTKIQYDSLLNVIISMNNKTYMFKGLIDSGNQLYDPISKMPIMFVSIKNRETEFPEALVKIAQNPEKVILGEELAPSEWDSKLRIVPCKVVGQEHQLIIAVKPDAVILEKENEFIKVERSLISFSLQQLSADDKFQCIVHPKMLTSTKKVHPANFIKHA